MKKSIWKMGILCLLCLMLVGYGAEKNKEVYDEEEHILLLYHKADIAYLFGMGGYWFTSRDVLAIRYKKETYENIFLYAGKDLADAAVERGEIGERDLYVYATETTLRRLEALNLYIKRTDLADKLDKYELEYPITLDDLINKTELFWQFMYDDSLIPDLAFERIVRS